MTDAHKVMDILGFLGFVQFEDMNSPGVNRPFLRQVQSLDAMERTLRYITAEVLTFPGAVSAHVTGKVESFMVNAQNYSVNDLEDQLNRLEGDFRRMREGEKVVLERQGDMVEALYVARVARAFASQGGGGGLSPSSMGSTAPVPSDGGEQPFLQLQRADA